VTLWTLYHSYYNDISANKELECIARRAVDRTKVRNLEVEKLSNIPDIFNKNGKHILKGLQPRYRFAKWWKLEKICYDSGTQHLLMLATLTTSHNSYVGQ
jgi:hypothetical protein